MQSNNGSCYNGTTFLRFNNLTEKKLLHIFKKNYLFLFYYPSFRWKQRNPRKGKQIVLMTLIDWSTSINRICWQNRTNPNGSTGDVQWRIYGEVCILFQWKGVLKGHLLLILMEVLLWLIPCMFQWSCKIKNLKLRQCLCNVDYINTCMFIVYSLCWTCIYVKLIIIIKFKLNRLGKDHTWSWKSGIKMWQANTLFLSFFVVIRRLMIWHL